MLSEQLNGVLRAVASALQTPVIIALLVLMAATVFLLGTLIVEIFTRSGTLSGRRERLLREAVECDASRRESVAIRLVKAEKSRYEGIVRLTDGIARLGPMMGLLGTLIPLGPGIIALGRGDTFTLSQSLLTAFDTTIAGLISAAVAFVISAVRRRWYAAHLASLESEMEDLLDAAEK
ncbi:MAG: MotA/TolQ/ExbB proton channel family protein [Oscillospiraceae bacterium]|jgi:biopolymer transport protein ExbB/TolQ|nr:MotA/TolQ/ExbB proton channel family protein [Oscillospiraceae bacterium]